MAKRKRYVSPDEQLRSLDWELQMSCYLIDRAPVEPNHYRYKEMKQHARKYLLDYPDAVSKALEKVISDAAERGVEPDEDSVYELLDPPLLAWMRSQGVMLHSHAASMYFLKSPRE